MNAILDHETVFPELTRIMRRLCQNRLEGLEPKTKLSDVAGLDSLRLLEAIALLEEHFYVQVDTDLLNDLTTVGDVVSVFALASSSHQAP